eukprot:TRINITY_DN8015_c0_g1_i1.p1 TRINITY_DN8015_c0_g1~~TRINITY_DN8015_c0_g1_i1.p1  ORF type:complete len:132 (-),score=27.08 TRINITY_DN8015_c0_g1_i1:122-517(-)
MGMNRKLVGVDKFGNKYYQYYTDEGEELKRVCEYNVGISEDNIDPNWDAWLRRMQKVPYTNEELEKLYDEQDNMREAAYDYEKRDAEMMREFRKAERQKKETEKTSTDQGYGKAYEPGFWKPDTKKSSKLK